MKCTCEDDFSNHKRIDESFDSSNRGIPWSDEEVRALIYSTSAIAIWGESKVQEELDGAVIQDISRRCNSKDVTEIGSSVGQK